MNEEYHWRRVVCLYQQVIDSFHAPITVTETMMIKAGIPQSALDTFVEEGRLERCRYINENGYNMPKRWMRCCLHRADREGSNTSI